MLTSILSSWSCSQPIAPNFDQLRCSNLQLSVSGTFDISGCGLSPANYYWLSVVIGQTGISLYDMGSKQRGIKLTYNIIVTTLFLLQALVWIELSVISDKRDNYMDMSLVMMMK